MNKKPLSSSRPSPLVLSIPNPCQENWEQMSITDQGRYCRNCKKQVIDLSASTDADIVSFLTRSTDGICGRLRSDQLNRNLTIEKKGGKVYPLYSKVAAAFLLLGIGASHANAAVKSDKPQLAIPGIPDSGFNTEKEETFIGKDSLKNTIEGIVIDSTTADPIPFVYIVAHVKDLTFVSHSDIDGRFKINLPSELQGDSVILAIKFLGYLPFQVSIAVKELPHKAEFRMRPDKQVNEKVTITTGFLVPIASDPPPEAEHEPKVTFRQKLRHPFTWKKNKTCSKQ